MGEIYALDTRADLVTLSSCESGLGKLDKADGLIGLNRAFVYTGIPNVVFFPLEGIRPGKFYLHGRLL